jgi:glycosyltransferase involved in cell wall biosynthesis
VGEREIVALHPVGEPGPYAAEVRHRIRRDVQSDYEAAAQALNDCGVDAVSLQHDFSIWGGDGSSYVLDFIRALRVPFVATLHSVISDPTAIQRDVLRELAATADATVVMSEAASAALTGSFGIDREALTLIPHGVPNFPLAPPEKTKPRLGLQGQMVILSFGLLAPGKGYEAAIDAMPAIVAAVPSAVYVILGVTQPDLRGRDGESYRTGLQERAAALGVAKNVRFIDNFVGRVELGTYLQAADVFLTPYPDLDQTVAGTLAYAMGAGKAIVSTPYAYATEMLAGDCGRLIPAGSSEALAEAVIALLDDAELRTAMGRRAYDRTRRMVWWEVGNHYRTLLAEAASARSGAGRRRNRVVAGVA